MRFGFHWSRFHKITEKQNNSPHLTNRRDSLFSSKKNRKFAIQQLLSPKISHSSVHAESQYVN
jgi:hypothetical protein